MDIMEEKSALGNPPPGTEGKAYFFYSPPSLPHLLSPYPLLKPNLWQIRWTRHHKAGRTKMLLDATALVQPAHVRAPWLVLLTELAAQEGMTWSLRATKNIFFVVAALEVFSLWIRIYFSDSQIWLIRISRGIFLRLSWGPGICTFKSHQAVVLTQV